MILRYNPSESGYNKIKEIANIIYSKLRGEKALHPQNTMRKKR